MVPRIEYTPAFLGMNVELAGLYSFAKSNCSSWNKTFTKVSIGTF